MKNWKEESKHRTVPIPTLISSKIKCPECNEKMELYGITDKGKWKYYCNNCHTIVGSWERG